MDQYWPFAEKKAVASQYVPQQSPSADYNKKFKAHELKPGKEYEFVGTATTGETRSYRAKYVGGALKFNFNGRLIDITIPNDEMNSFQYVGYVNHGGSRRSNRRSNRSRKARKNRTLRK